MKIAIINYEEPWHVLASTSLIKGLSNNYKNCSITFFIQQESFPILSFNKKANIALGENGYNNDFDFVFNLSPNDFCCSLASSLSNNKIGFIKNSHDFGFSNKEVEDYYSIVYGKQKTEKNFFQILYRFCGITWKGEGYDLSYYPKNRAKKNTIGLSIYNEGLRGFVKNNLQITGVDVSVVPCRKSLLKKMDEINRHMYVITDDLFSLHASIALRKEVEFLDTTGLQYRIEFFSKGNYYGISNAAWNNPTSKNKREEYSRFSC